MTLLASDPTAAAALAAVPCYPVPISGHSPAIDSLRAAQSGHGLAIGNDGVMLILRRPWLAADVLLSPALPVHLPYGSVGAPGGALRCGLIPGQLLDRSLAHFMAALPNEAAAFVIWNATTRSFAVQFPAIDHASPSRLVYRPPALPADCHLVIDIHSHGHGPAFFSATDDADDAHATKIALVAGRIAHPDGAEIAARLCVAGMFLPLPYSPFAGEDHAG